MFNREEKNKTEKQRRLDEYASMINAVDSKLADISQIISNFDLELSHLVDERLTDFVDYVENKSKEINL
jgi:hypothetical protein